MTQGIVFLFFGDHDVHSQQLAGILLYFLFSTLYLRNRCDIILPALFFSIASLLHLSTIILAPSLFFLPVLKSNKYLKHPIVKFFGSLFSKESLKIVLGLILPFIIFLVLCISTKPKQDLWTNLW